MLTEAFDTKEAAQKILDEIDSQITSPLAKSKTKNFKDRIASALQVQPLNPDTFLTSLHEIPAHRYKNGGRDAVINFLTSTYGEKFTAGFVPVFYVVDPKAQYEYGQRLETRYPH